MCFFKYKQSLVTLSFSNAEIVLLCECVCKSLALLNLIQEIGIKIDVIEVHEDNNNYLQTAVQKRLKI